MVNTVPSGSSTLVSCRQQCQRSHVCWGFTVLRAPSVTTGSRLPHSMGRTLRPGRGAAHSRTGPRGPGALLY